MRPLREESRPALVGGGKKKYETKKVPTDLERCRKKTGKGFPWGERGTAPNNTFAETGTGAPKKTSTKMIKTCRKRFRGEKERLHKSIALIMEVRRKEELLPFWGD